MDQITRREFIDYGALAGTLLLGCSSKKKYAATSFPPLLDQAPDGPELKAGLIGCGGRGTGAVMNFLDAGPNLTITALADLFPDRLEYTRNKIQNQTGIKVPQEQCFLGFDAYQKLIDTDVDVVLLATPPHFRPEHFKAAVKARKHVFMEKPMAVDPVGVRSIITTSKQAEKMGLCVTTGTQRRHGRDYVETYKRVADGAIGDIVSVTLVRNQGSLWYRKPRPEWSEMESMIRDWVNWRWLSGDHIVEQHVHRIDIIHWFTGKIPVRANGYGGRHRRVTGDQFDFFSIDYIYDNNLHAHCATRQINGCSNRIEIHMQGTKGYTNCNNKIYSLDGDVLWQYPYPQDDSGKSSLQLKVNPYLQEHIDLVTNIRNNNPVVWAETTALSTMIAIMGRESAYTGKEVTWDEIMTSDMRLGPTEYAMGPVDIEKKLPVPGIS